MAVVTPDLPEIFEEAFERAGQELRSGYDLKTARRSFNLLTLSGKIVDSIFGLLRAVRNRLPQALQPILSRQTLLTFWNTSYARAVGLIKRIRTWSASAYQRMLNKIKKIFKGDPPKSS